MYDDLHYLISVCCTDCESKADKESCDSCKVHKIKDKYGKNSLIKASSLYEDSTAIERNKKIGGHNA